jgi:hypothetical protein
MQLGSVVYNLNQAASLGPGAANNGLSVAAGVVQLGGPLGAAGSAALLNNREIPFGGNSLSFTGPGSLDITNLSDGNGTGTFSITTNGGQPFIHTGVRNGGFSGSLFIGYQAGLGQVGAAFNVQSVVALGQGALQAYTPLATVNYRGVVIGPFAGQSEDAGVGNVLIGWAAGLSGVNFSNNAFIGSVSGTNIDNGSSQNTFVGIGSGGTDIGNTAGGIGTANNCVLIGYLAGGDMGTASNWTGVIMIGEGTGSNTNSQVLTNTTLIGTGLKTNVNNVVMLGLSTQNVMIGAANNTADNGNRLQIAGKLNTGGAAPLTTAAGAMDFGSVKVAASVLNATQYLEVSVNGALVKVCIN